MQPMRFAEEGFPLDGVLGTDPIGRSNGQHPLEGLWFHLLSPLSTNAAWLSPFT